MKRPEDFAKILMYSSPVDMRKQFPGLARVVEDYLFVSPFKESHLFVFTNKKTDILKALYFEGSGYCLWSKKLDQGKFPWPAKIKTKKLLLAPSDLASIFEGVDVFKRHPRLESSLTTRRKRVLYSNPRPVNINERT